MSLADIANLSQIIASVAVVASLIYLAVQVGQTERNQRATMQQGRADRAAGGALVLAAPQMATVFRKGMSGDPALMCRGLLQFERQGSLGDGGLASVGRGRG